MPLLSDCRIVGLSDQENASGVGFVLVLVRLGQPVTIEPFPHFLTGLEERYAFLVDRHMRAGPRIAAGTRRTMLHRKRTKAAQLDAVTARKSSDDLVEDRIDDVLDIPLVEMRVVLGDTLNKLGFDHREMASGKVGFAFP